MPPEAGMVGRELERAELAAALDDARAGRGRVALVLGEAGMGKSVLADWLVDRARTAGVAVVRGGCSAAGMAPLWPIRQTLGSLAPGWQRGAADAPSLAARDAAAAAAVQVVADVARRAPLAVVLEDLHWADAASLTVLRAIVDATPALPVLLLLTSRDDGDGLAPGVEEHLAALPAAVRRIALPPLGPAAAAELAARVVGHALPERDAAELRSRTGGNPFFVHEVARLLAAHGPAGTLVVPPGVRDVLRRRVARVSQACAAVLAVAAVAAEPVADVVDAALLHALGAAGEETALRALLDEAVAARLLEVDPAWPSRYRFRHALVREVVEQGQAATDRGRWHARVAAALEEGGEPPAAARLAHHWCRAVGAGADERAAEWSARAGREAMAGFGFAAAARHFARALAGPVADRVTVSIEHGEALRLAGEPAAAREALLRAGDAAAQAGRPVDLARAALALGGGVTGFEVATGDAAQVELLRRAEAALPDGEAGLRAAVRGRLSLASAGLVPDAERRGLAEAAVAQARRAGDGVVESAVLAAHCDAIAGPDHVDDRIAAATRMLALAGGGPAEDVRRRETGLLARRLLVVAHLERGDLAAAEEQALAYELVARQSGSPQHTWLPEIWRGMRALLHGDPDRALAHAAAAEAVGLRAGSLNAELMVFVVRMQAHLDRGTAAQYADTVDAVLTRLGPAGSAGVYYATPARLLLAAGRPDLALTVLRSCAPDAAAKDAEWLEGHWAMADLAVALDDRPAAEVLLAALRPYGHLWAVDGLGGAVFGRIAEQVGRLAAHLGRADEASRCLTAARDGYRDQRLPALVARVDGLAPAAAADPPATGRLRRDGDVWVVEWRGRRTLVPDTKGMRDLAVLLARPGRAVPALELVAAAGGPPAAAAGSGLGPVLDDAARVAYRRRLGELDGEIDEAEAGADLGTAGRLRAERALLLEELRAAVGLGGRPRIAGDPADRARKAVTMRIRAAVTAIARQDDALARHLRNAVRTGRLCAYEPEVPVTWQG